MLRIKNAGSIQEKIANVGYDCIKIDEMDHILITSSCQYDMTLVNENEPSVAIIIHEISDHIRRVEADALPTNTHRHNYSKTMNILRKWYNEECLGTSFIVLIPQRMVDDGVIDFSEVYELMPHFKNHIPHMEYILLGKYCCVSEGQLAVIKKQYAAAMGSPNTDLVSWNDTTGINIDQPPYVPLTSCDTKEKLGLIFDVDNNYNLNTSLDCVIIVYSISNSNYSETFDTHWRNMLKGRSTCIDASTMFDNIYYFAFNSGDFNRVLLFAKTLKQSNENIKYTFFTKEYLEYYHGISK